MNRYDELKSLGKCPSHATVDAVLGGTLCQICIDRKSTRAAELKTQGLCIVCGAPAATETQCEVHRQNTNASSNYLHRTRRAAGLCVQCGEPSAPFYLCERCRLQCRIKRLDVSPEEKQRATEAVRLFDGRCQCCGGADAGGRGWCLDHCHETHTFRGIVCGYCNAMLGMARDSVKILLGGVLYLEASRKDFHVKSSF